MTPEELHKRILLHELRTILLDETREGTQLPEWKEPLTQNPHEEIPYLVLADWLDDQGDELGELIRIQCELIPQLYTGDTHLHVESQLHPFKFDLDSYANYPDLYDGEWPAHQFPNLFKHAQPNLELLSRRLEITKELYPPRQVHFGMELLQASRPPTQRDIEAFMVENQFDLKRPYQEYRDERNRCHTFEQDRKLGRTTRLLTDTLRYCVANKGNHQVVIQGNPSQLRTQLCILIDELFGTHILDVQNVSDYRGTLTVYGNLITFDQSGIISGDITFTDHAVNSWPQATATNGEYDFFSPLIVNYTQQTEQEVTRQRRILQHLMDAGRIQYNPKAFINPDNS